MRHHCYVTLMLAAQRNQIVNSWRRTALCDRSSVNSRAKLMLIEHYIRPSKQIVPVYLQKLRPLRETDGVVAILELWIVGNFPANCFHLLIRMHKISTFVVFDDIVADSYWLDVCIGTNQIAQKIPKRPQTKWKATSVAYNETQLNYLNYGWWW